MNEQLPHVRFTPKQRLFIEAYLIHKNRARQRSLQGSVSVAPTIRYKADVK